MFEKGFILQCALSAARASWLNILTCQESIVSLEYYHYSYTFYAVTSHCSPLSLPLFIFILLLYTTHSFLQVATLDLPAEKCDMQNSSCNLSSAFAGQSSSLQPCNKACDKYSGWCVPCSGVTFVWDALIGVKSCKSLAVCVSCWVTAVGCFSPPFPSSSHHHHHHPVGLYSCDVVLYHSVVVVCRCPCWMVISCWLSAPWAAARPYSSSVGSR